MHSYHPRETIVTIQSGVGSESPKAAWIREMFSQIAPRYDFLNHALSMNSDKRWRRFTAHKLSDVLDRPGARVLDLCCGTADLSLELAAKSATWAVDFCHPMLTLGLKKAARAGFPLFFIEGDALNVPFRSCQFDAVTIAFGLRNLESIEAGLAEIYRVLNPGGRAAILEFSRPRLPVLGRLFDLYFTYILPRIGKVISGSESAYRYLPESVKAFPNQRSLSSMMCAVGFSGVRYYNLSGGIAALHLGEKLSSNCRL
jgi:demethylmenaquinone methyltransferase/2-methoxy-6-polyprenyl-1,4-benzoquinol methylase